MAHIGVVNDRKAKSKIETTSGVVVHSYFGNQTRKARRVLGIVSIFDLGHKLLVSQRVNRENPKLEKGELTLWLT